MISKINECKLQHIVHVGRLFLTDFWPHSAELKTNLRDKPSEDRIKGRCQERWCDDGGCDPRRVGI
jgi:hypothetical protein